MEHTGTTPTDPSPQAQAQVDEIQPSRPAEAAGEPASESPGFQPRGRARRRARFLRKARELAYRDLGGLVFNLHRFGQRNDVLVLAKLTTLGQIDTELRTIETSLGERRPITVLREAGITACPRCAAIHSSEDSFCPNCGMSMGRHADLPIAGAATQPAPAPQPPTPQPAPTPQTAPSAQSAPTPQPTPAPTPSATPPSAAGAPPAGAPASGATQAATSAPDPAATPVPAASPAGRAPSPPGADMPTEILRPPVSGS